MHTGNIVRVELAIRASRTASDTGASGSLTAACTALADITAPSDAGSRSLQVACVTAPVACCTAARAAMCVAAAAWARLRAASAALRATSAPRCCLVAFACRCHATRCTGCKHAGCACCLTCRGCTCCLQWHCAVCDARAAHIRPALRRLASRAHTIRVLRRLAHRARSTLCCCGTRCCCSTARAAGSVAHVRTALQVAYAARGGTKRRVHPCWLDEADHCADSWARERLCALGSPGTTRPRAATRRPLHMCDLHRAPGAGDELGLRTPNWGCGPRVHLTHGAESVRLRRPVRWVLGHGPTCARTNGRGCVRTRRQGLFPVMVNPRSFDGDPTGRDPRSFCPSWCARFE
jgi:hypothetical protein